MLKQTKKIFLRPLWILCLVIAVAATLTSCGDEYYDYSPIQGRWELVEIDGYPVSEMEVSEFTFYSGGTGVYGQYNPYPHWSVYQISWELDYADGGAEYLYVYPAGGGVWRYLLRLYPTYMELTDLDTGQRLVYDAI